MKFNSKLTGALAWAGLIVVLAVPAADWLTADADDAAGMIVPEADGTSTASLPAQPLSEPDAAPAGNPVAPSASAQSPDPVDAYIASGRKLPSYISDPPPGVAAEGPAPVMQLVVPDPPTAAASNAAAPSTLGVDAQVAAIAEPPGVDAPIPYPASRRPPPPTFAAAPTGANNEPPLIIDEDLVQRREAAVARVLDPDPSPGRIVSGSELEEWDSGSLAEYLRRRGLLNEDASTDVGTYHEENPDRSRVRVIRRLPPSEFFLF